LLLKTGQVVQKLGEVSLPLDNTLTYGKASNKSGSKVQDSCGFSLFCIAVSLLYLGLMKRGFHVNILGSFVFLRPRSVYKLL